LPPEKYSASATSGRARRQRDTAQENREMRRYRWWLGSLLVAAFALAPALAAWAGDPGEETKKKKREGRKGRKRKGEGGGRKRGRKGLFEQINAACTLTDEQKAKLKEACEKYQAAQKDSAKETAGLRKEMAEARKNKDKDKAKELAAKMKELRKPVDDAMAAVMAGLTAEQKLAWEGHRMATMILGRLKKTDLTQEQKDKVLALCKKKLESLKGADEKSKRRAMGETFKEVYESVLTADQKAQVKAPPERKERPQREKKKGRRGKKKVE
jgi:Spy/CpxP family protein refolding chaperone